jgi:hypothetical protein
MDERRLAEFSGRHDPAGKVMERWHLLELFGPEMAIQADKGRDFGIFPVGVGKVPDARFLLELLEFFDSLADERVRIFHVCISTSSIERIYS